MGTCAYEVFHLQRAFQERHKNRLPHGVYDDKQWTYTNKSESEMKNDRIAIEDHKNDLENLDKESYCVWDPVVGDFQST